MLSLRPSDSAGAQGTPALPATPAEPGREPSNGPLGGASTEPDPSAGAPPAVTLSVCIVSYKRQDLILRCLDAVFNTITTVPFEVLVCENGSGDGTAALIAERCPRARLFVNADNRGFAAANNQLMAHASGTLVLLLNNDCIVSNGAIDAMVHFMSAHPSVGIAGGRVVFPDGVLQPSFQKRLEGPLANYSPTRFGRAKRQERLLSSRRSLAQRLAIATQYATEQGYSRDQQVAVVIGAFMMLRRTLITQHGAFDERYFMYREDSELCVRAARAGWQVYYCHDALAVHHHITRAERDVGRAQLLEAAYCDSQLRFSRAYFPWWQSRLLAITLCVVALIRIVALACTLPWSIDRSSVQQRLQIHLRIIPRVLSVLGERPSGPLSSVAQPDGLRSGHDGAPR
jgi:hypothetical protein